MPPRSMLSVQATPDVANIRTATLFKEEHTIVPCVALVEGVLWPANAPAPELALAEEFGRFPDGWNGRPVVFDHPKVNGMAVSASHPEVMEEVAFGSLFNTSLEDGKLKTEIWINNARVEGMSEDVQNAVKRLKEGDEMVEVSTGLFTMTEVASGQFKGEEFEAIWRNVVPDHLAVLPEGVKGACSVEDGCGAPRSNKRYVMNAEYVTNTSTELKLDSQGCKKCKGSCDCKVEQKGKFQKAMELVGNVFGFKSQSATMSDADVRTAIASRLAEEEDFFFIMAVFDHGDGSGKFVYESFMQGKLFEQDFNVSESGVSLGEERVEVRPVTQFVPVHNAGAMSTQQENDMNPKDQLVQELIANEATQYSEDDRDWLSTLEESQLAKMSPVVNEVVEEEEGGDGEELPAAAIEEPAVVENAAKPVSTDDYIAAAPDEVREVLSESLRLHRSRKDALIAGILNNARNKFTKDQLCKKGLDELESIASLAKDITYEGMAPTGASQHEDDGAPPAPQVFDLNAARK